jgi:lipopolysaccharide export system protein LptA
MTEKGRAAAVLTVAAAALLWWSGPAAAAQSGPPGAAPAGRPPLEVTGATRIEYDDASQQWVFAGPRVVVVRGTTRLEAPEMLYAERAREVTLPRGGTIATPTLEVTADRLVTDLQSRHVTADGHVSGRFSDEAPPYPQTTWGTFRADHVVVDDRQDLKQMVATGQVVILRGDRRLSGDRIVYNHQSQQGTVDGHATLEQGTSRLRADRVFADLWRREARADGHVLLDHHDMRGSADHATYSEAAQTAVLDGHVVLLRGRDTLTAQRATVLLDRDTAIAEGDVSLVAYPEGSTP